MTKETSRKTQHISNNPNFCPDILQHSQQSTQNITWGNNNNICKCVLLHNLSPQQMRRSTRKVIAIIKLQSPLPHHSKKPPLLFNITTFNNNFFTLNTNNWTQHTYDMIYYTYHYNNIEVHCSIINRDDDNSMISAYCL